MTSEVVSTGSELALICARYIIDNLEALYTSGQLGHLASGFHSMLLNVLTSLLHQRLTAYVSSLCGLRLCCACSCTCCVAIECARVQEWNSTGL